MSSRVSFTAAGVATTTTLAMGLLLLAGCAALLPLQEATARLDEAAHDLAQAQDQFWADLQAANCDHQKYHDLASRITNGKPVSLQPRCDRAALVLTDQQVQVRQQLMLVLTLYTDTMLALAADGSSARLPEQSRAVARQLSSLAATLGHDTGDAQVSGVATAITALMEVVLDRDKFTDVQGAAAAADSSLAVLATLLTAENNAFLEGLQGSTEAVAIDLALLLAFEQTHAILTLSDVLQAQQVLGGLPSAAAARATQLNTALAALTEANHALASSQRGGVTTNVREFVSRVKALSRPPVPPVGTVR